MSDFFDLKPCVPPTGGNRLDLQGNSNDKLNE